jgi:hypothetical protein
MVGRLLAITGGKQTPQQTIKLNKGGIFYSMPAESDIIVFLTQITLISSLSGLAIPNGRTESKEID